MWFDTSRLTFTNTQQEILSPKCKFSGKNCKPSYNFYEPKLQTLHSAIFLAKIVNFPMTHNYPSPSYTQETYWVVVTTPKLTLYFIILSCCSLFHITRCETLVSIHLRTNLNYILWILLWYNNVILLESKFWTVILGILPYIIKLY